MIFWYENLFLSESLVNKKKTCQKIIEKRSKWQKLPWKKSFYVLTLASNSSNLFEILNTDQMFFKYYENVELYVLGIFQEEEEATEMVQKIMEEGYEEDTHFDPRVVYTRDKFSPGKKNKARR